MRALGHFEFEVLIGHLGGDGDMGLELTKDARADDVCQQRHLVCEFHRAHRGHHLGENELSCCGPRGQTRSWQATGVAFS